MTQQSDTQEWVPFLEAHRPRLLGWFRSRTPRREDAEDMTQTVMLCAAQHLPTLRDKRAAVAFINKIAAHVLAGWSRPKYRSELTNILHAQQTEDSPDCDRREQSYAYLFQAQPLDPEESTLRAADQQSLMEKISCLSASDQTLLTLCYLKNLSHKEIAEIQDTTPTAVKQAMMRVRKRLKEILEAYRGREE